MQANRGSQTAEAIAAARAFHLARDGAPKIFEDPYAIRLVPESGCATLEVAVLG